MIDRSSIPPARAAAFLAAVLCLAPQLALAQTRAFQKAPGKLELRLKSSHPVIRSGAPFTLELEFESTFPDVIEGPLELTFSDGDRIHMRFHTTPIAIPADAKTSISILLPALACRRNADESQVDVVLDARRKTFRFGKHDFRLPLRGMRQFVIGVVGMSQVDVGELARHLSLDEFRPPKLHRQNFATNVVELDPHRISGDTIGLYPYDVVVLAGQHFSVLSARQLETVAAWTESGGAVVVVPTGPLTDAHRNFLAKVRGISRDDLPLDALGHLAPLAANDRNQLVTVGFAFGRAVVLRSIPQFAANGTPSTVSRSEWIRALGFLWNVHADQVESMLTVGSWKMPSPPPRKAAESKNSFAASGGAAGLKMSVPDLRYLAYADPGGLKPEEPAAADQLRDLLFPADVRVVPFGIVIGLLASFLIAVAPADYWILGWLRRRRYTWIVFPCVSLFFTTLTVCIAGYYSGNTDHRGALVIVDVGQSGRPLRTSRIVHVVTADTHTLVAEIHDGLFARTEVQPAQLGVARPNDPLDALPALEDDELAYEGRVPSAYSVSWPSKQWSPAMHRVTRAGMDVELPQIDWAVLDRLDLSTEAGRSAAIGCVRRILPQCGLLFSNAKADVEVPFPATSEGAIDQFRDWPNVLASLGRRRDHGLLAILFGVSPNGAGDLEDLAVLDDGLSSTWLVHVAIVRDNDLIVFRHVVRKTQVRDIDASKNAGGKRGS
jgi:hypothetical protein